MASVQAPFDFLGSDALPAPMGGTPALDWLRPGPRETGHQVAQTHMAAHTHLMQAAVTGVVRGNTVALDEPVPPLEGQRVRVTLEPLPSVDLELSGEEQSRLLREWAERGPQGPLDSEDPWPGES